MFDDAVYFTSLVICMSLGNCYKKIEDPNTKRNYGAGLGVLTACLICGHHVYHTVFMVWGNIIIIKCCDKRYAYQISLSYTWIYLMYLHFNFQNSSYLLWLHQTMALRMVGLAFEIANDKKSSSASLSGSEPRVISVQPDAVDIIAYAYFFIGLQKGPYYKWKIFNDHFKYPFGVLGDCRIITIQKLKKALICGLGYILIRIQYPPEIYYENEFYSSFAADSRYLHNVPQLMLFFLKYQCLMMLSSSVCTEAGFGVYPAKCHPMPGVGPTARLSLLNMAANSPDVALEQEYNFTMLKCFDNEKLLLGPRMRDTLRAWDMPIRYWFWSNIYKMPIKANKELRSALSFMVWTLWCGPSIQQLVLSSTLWVHLHLEKEYTELYNTGGPMKMTWNIGFSIMRVFCLIYLTPCTVIMDAEVLIKYYFSIFWAYHILLITLIVAAVIIHKAKL